MNDIFIIPSMLCSNPVLQRDQVIPIWGECSADGPVAVAVNGQSYYGTAKGGKFCVNIAPQPAGGPYDIVIFNATHKYTVQNVLFGDVYLCSGQSNMFMQMAACHYPELTQSSANKNLRMLTVPSSIHPEMTENVCWIEASPAVVPGWSAAAYLFGRTLQEKLNVPIGIVQASVGDTTLGPWTPEQEMEGYSDPFYSSNNRNRFPSVYFNGMIQPFTQMQFKGVVWYQGENQPIKYDEMLCNLINGWRREFCQPLPFLVVQLPRFSQGDDESWYISRQMQKDACTRLTDVWYTVNLDTGKASNDLNQSIHLDDKFPIGDRLSDLALEKIYHIEGVLSSPILERYEKNGNEIRLEYSNVGDGLKLINGAKGFELKDASGAWIAPADVRAEGNTVIITAPGDNIQAMRYAYGAFPENSLYNSGDYPAEQLKIAF